MVSTPEWSTLIGPTGVDTGVDTNSCPEWSTLIGPTVGVDTNSWTNESAPLCWERGGGRLTYGLTDRLTNPLGFESSICYMELNKIGKI